MVVNVFTASAWAGAGMAKVTRPVISSNVIPPNGLGQHRDPK